jgi:hypothetical protein
MEFIGTVQFFNNNGKRGNPIALYLERFDTGECRITSRVPAWRHLVGIGVTPNKAAGDFELKLKETVPDSGAYDGPAWNGIKAEKPAPAKPGPAVPVPKPAAPSPQGADANIAGQHLTGPASTAADAGAPGVATAEDPAQPA